MLLWPYYFCNKSSLNINSIFFPDTEPPSFTHCPANQILTTNSTKHAVTATWNMPTTVDNSGRNSTVTCTRDSPSRFNIGNTVVMCTAIDEYGNEAICEFTVNVVIGEDEVDTKCNRDVVPI